METHRSTVRFDGPGVHAVGARLLESADDATRDVRRALGSTETGPGSTGHRYAAAGWAIEDGYRRLRRSCELWVEAVQRHGDSLRATAYRYEERERDTVDGLSRADRTSSFDAWDVRP